ncbi:Protein plant cadmium resistance 6 [Vitis vinifera]|uniref:Protein plant cadmium resistance 6 n=1 Tax=Vitis vinifera TaxID=29760 RepID=A0A438EAM4_VITVI|nr:Protein plant cadmium resistance 6 [Vitis vinifera]
MQPGSQVPSQSPHAIPLDPVQPMQFPPQPGNGNLSHTTHSSGQYLQSNPVQYPAQQAQFIPQHQQTNVACHAHQPTYNPAQPVPASYHVQSTNFQPSPAAMQYVPVHQTHATMVVPLQQTAPVIVVQSQPRVTTVGTEAWTTGLFDCMDDPTNALVTCCVPCLTFGQVAEIVDNGHTSCGTSALVYGAIACLIGCPFLISCTYRTKLRSRYGLVESPAPDWVVHCLCDFCALCQEYRELQNRGFDPSIGWHANVARHMQQQQVAMVVPPNQTMIG